MTALAEVFVAHVPEALRSGLAQLSGLEAQLHTVLDAGRSQWPGIAVSDKVFVADLALILARDPDAYAALGGIAAADLYLAVGCARGDRVALETFRGQYLAQVDKVVASLHAAPALADEVKQAVCEKLLAVQEGGRPRLFDYTGRGRLETWLRVIATRMAVSLLRKSGREVGARDDEILALRAPEDNPELAVMKQRYRADFKAAFEEAVATLEVRQRNLLRYQLVDGLTVDQIAAIYRVHRVTASRWLGRARNDVWRSTRRALSARLGTSSAEVRSLLRVIRTDLDLSLTRVLKSTVREDAR